MLSVFIKGCGSDALQLASGECWLKNVGGIDGTFSGTCTNQCVHLVDHQNHISGRFDFLHDLFEALLKFTSVLRTRNQQSDVEGQDPLVFKDVWDVSLLNALS